MPYPGVPKDKWPEMESCVRQVMGQGKDKSSAIAICHKAVMGDKKKAEMPPITFNINLNGETYSYKADGANVSSTTDIELEEDLKGGEQNMTKKDEKIEKQDDEKEVVAPEGEADKEVEAPKEEAPAEEAKPEDAPEVKPEEAGDEKKEDEVVAGDKAVDLLKQLVEKVDKLVSSQKPEDSASTEGAASKDSKEEIEKAAPEGGEKETPVEDKASEDASPEGAEDVTKMVDGIAKIADRLAKFEDTFKSFDTKLDDMGKRVTAIEAQPVPSKVASPKVVSKEDSSSMSKSEDDTRVKEIEAELGVLEELRKNDMTRYQKEKKWEKAFALIDEKNRLLSVA